MTNLKPCPFCGEDKIVHGWLGVNDGYCRECLAQSTAWNDRAWGPHAWDWWEAVGRLEAARRDAYEQQCIIDGMMDALNLRCSCPKATG